MLSNRTARRAGGGHKNRGRAWLAPEGHAPGFDGRHGPGRVGCACAGAVLFSSFSQARDRGDSFVLKTFGGVVVVDVFAYFTVPLGCKNIK